MVKEAQISVHELYEKLIYCYSLTKVDVFQLIFDQAFSVFVSYLVRQH